MVYLLLVHSYFCTGLLTTKAIWGDIGVISFHIYASWFLHLVGITLRNVCYSDVT